MTNTSTTFVFYNLSGQLLSNLEISLRREGEEGVLPVRPEFDPETVSYRYTGLEPGRYHLHVSGRDIRGEERVVTVKKSRRRHDLMLAQEGDDYYPFGNQRIYFRKDERSLAVRVRFPDGIRTDARARMRIAGERGMHPLLQEGAANGAIVKIPGDTDLEGLAAQLRHVGAVAQVGVPLELGPGLVGMLDGQVYVRTRDYLTAGQVASLVEPLGFIVLEENYYDARGFTLLYKDLGMSYELIDRCKELAAMEEFSSVSPGIVARKETMAPVYTGDLLSYTQWHLDVMHLPQAWELLQLKNIDLTHGSADVIIGVHDTGVKTSGSVNDPSAPAPQHQEFQGNVGGGTLTALIGNSRKTYFAFDYTQDKGLTKNIQPNNDAVTGSHGTSVSGLATARTDGTRGVVGVAPNARLMSMLYLEGGPGQLSTPTQAADGDVFLYTSGMYPGWFNDGVNYSAATFPPPFGTKLNIGPGAHVINMSHSYPVVPLLNEDGTAMATVSSFGRNRRGVVMVVAAGNEDQDLRNSMKLGADTHTIVVAGSTLDNYGRETRTPYSCFDNLRIDPGVDVCAPVDSTGPDTVHQPPLRYAVITSELVGAGNQKGVPSLDIAIANAPAAGTKQVQIPSGNYGSFSAGDQIVIRQAMAPFRGELHTVASKTSPDKLVLTNALANGYAAGDRLIKAITADYTNEFSGTSAATPMVSGVAALVLSANPALNWLEVRDILRRTATPIGLRYRGFDDRNRWVELDVTGTAESARLLTPHGTLDIVGGKQLVTFPSLLKGATQINIGTTAGYATRSTILIGAETLTTANPLASGSFDIPVADELGFASGDQIIIGNLAETYITDTAPHTTAVPGSSATAGDDFVHVQDVSGFREGEEVLVNPGDPNEESMTIRSGGGGFPGGYYSGTGGESFTIRFTGTLAHTHPVGTRIIAKKRETATVLGAPTGGIIHIAGSTGLANSYPKDTVVTRVNTQTRVVLEVLNGAELRIDPLEFPLNGDVQVARGHRADYSYGLGYGRVDAEAAVRMALNYTHDERDLMIRNFIGDDGVLNRSTQPVHSPDLWVTNGTSSPAASVADYARSGPHEHPRTSVSAPVFIGSGTNDLSAGGSYSGALAGTYTISINSAGTPDTFTWQKDDGVISAPQNIVAGDITVAEGVTIRFASTTLHTAGSRWVIRVEPLADRHVHLRVANRGTLQMFPRSGGTNALPVNYYRMLLCLSDGTPVSRFYGRGLNDLQVMTPYNGLGRETFTVQLVAPTGAGQPDRFKWAKGQGAFSPAVAITPGVAQLLSDGVSIRFAASTGHTVDDIWVLRCYPEAQRYVTVDHYVESNSTPAFSLTSNVPGTWLVAEKELDRLAANEKRYYSEPWPENNRPVLNSPGLVQPALPLRMFLLGEVTPHDGTLMGDIAEQNNNFSYREIIFARFGFKQVNLVEDVANYIEVDSFGTVTHDDFNIQVVSDVSTFRTQSVKLEFVMTRIDGSTETKVFEFTGGSWGFTGGAPVWADMDPSPVKADGTPAAGEQYYAVFAGRMHLSRDHKSLKITPKIHSAVNPGVVLAEESRTIPVYEQAKLASSRYTGTSAADLVPQSHFFTDHAAVAVQADTMAYGPVISGTASDKQNKYRVTGLFKAAADVNAYAVVDGFFMIQRVADPGSPGSYLPNVINLVLKPYRQAMLGFTPVKYFVYRNLRLDNFLKGTSSADEKLVRPQAGANAFIQSLWGTHTNQNGAVPFESSALGYDPATQTGTGKIDKLFNRQDPNKQLPFVGRGTNIGKFYTNSGADPFGIEIILEEGEFQPDFNYARRYKETIIDVSGLPSGTPQEKFTIRLKREEILNYIDPAAFFGMDMSKDGWLQVDDGAGNKTKLAGAGIYDNVIAKFHTRNTLYLDIRNENGLSLNFYGKYDDGSAAHNALEAGDTPGSLAAQPYASEQWPVLIRPSVSAANPEDRNEVFIRLRRDYNHKPVVYIEHGRVSTGSQGRFIAGTTLIAPAAPKTEVLGFTFPNKDLGSGNRIGVAWTLKLHYTMRQDPANVPFPAEVVPTAGYLDNLFGPADMEPFWAVGSPVIAWSSLQDKKYVDGEGIENLGFEHIANRGVAFSHWMPGGGTTGTVLFYAAAKDNFFNEWKKFVPHNALASGTSKRKSFFEEPMLFDGYTIGYDVFTDGSTEVLSMQLQEVPPDPRPAEAMLLLGLTRSQLETTLKPLAGFDSRYPRTILLQEVAGSPFTDAAGSQYRKYKTGLRGMNSSGTAHQAFPATDLFVYTVDRKFFFSHAFTQAQTLPTAYLRNYEESLGTRTRFGATYPISAAAGMTVTVAGQNLLHEIVPGDKVNIKGTDRLVASVTFAGGSSQITLTTSPGALAPGTDTVRGPNKSYEDYFIAKDQLGTLSGIERIAVPVSTFIALVNGVANTSAAPAALESIINNYAPDVLKRARLFCNNAGFSYADDRTLYWARIKMAVALKSHPYLLKVLKQRNRLVALLETTTRGYDSVSFASAGGRKKVLLTGFDPFKLEDNIKQSNPSGASVLALHGQNFTDGTSNIHIQTAIFPVRYADFDQNPPPNAGTGVVESFIERFINPAHPAYAAADVPDIIVTLSQGVYFTFWLERFAGRNRGGNTDNLNMGNIPFPATVPGDEFYQTTLPHGKIVPASQTAGVFDVIYHETYEYTWKSGGIDLTVDESVGPDPSTLTEATIPKKSEIVSVSGSGSNYLSNEIFYRVSRLRQLHNAAMKTGHYHLPALQHDPGTTAASSPVNAGVKSTEDFSDDLTRRVVEEVRNSLLRAFS